MKTLILKPRMKDEKGEPVWHDYFILANALASIAKGKSYVKMALWINIAGRIQLAKEEIVKDGDAKILNPIEVEINNTEARLLWDEMMKLNIEGFGAVHPMTGQPQVPPVGTWQLMMRDFAEQLGKELPVEEGDEKE